MISHIRTANISNDAERVALCQSMNAEEWAGPLTVEQHVVREGKLETVLDANGMKMRHWALELQTSQGWEIVCSMDTVERPAYVKMKGFKPMETVNHVIDAVFTPEQHRRKGYAKILIKEVCQQLETLATAETEQLIDPIALSKSLITLWSDVGDYYRQFGFQSADANQIVTACVPDAKWPRGVRALNSEQSRMSVHNELEVMLASISVKTERDGRTRAVVAPTQGILHQMQVRAEYMCECLGLKAPEVFGARTANGWAAWAYQISDKKLYILGIFGPMLEMVQLFQAAQAAAAKYGFGVVMYEGDLLHVDKPVTEAFLEALNCAGIAHVYEARPDSLPYYMQSGTRSDVLLEYPGKYSWF